MERQPLGPEAIEQGRRIRARRHRLGLTGEDMRRLAHIHPTSLSFIERGLREPTGEQWRFLAAALRTRVSRLFVDRASPSET